MRERGQEIDTREKKVMDKKFNGGGGLFPLWDIICAFTIVFVIIGVPEAKNKARRTSSPVQMRKYKKDIVLCLPISV